MIRYFCGLPAIFRSTNHQIIGHNADGNSLFNMLLSALNPTFSAIRESSKVFTGTTQSLVVSEVHSNTVEQFEACLDLKQQALQSIQTKIDCELISLNCHSRPVRAAK